MHFYLCLKIDYTVKYKEGTILFFCEAIRNYGSYHKSMKSESISAIPDRADGCFTDLLPNSLV